MIVGYFCALALLFVFMARSAARGGDQESLFFAANIPLMWGLSAALFGFAGFIIHALGLVALALGTLVLLTRG